MRFVLGFLVSLLFAASFCHGDHVEVVGVAECSDCAETNFKPTHAVKGLKVRIECKAPNGEKLKTRGFGEVDGEGNFKVSLPEEVVEDGEVKEECYVQLQSASATPCPAHDGLDSTKLVLRSEDGQKHVFGVSGKLRFSPTLCPSAFFWHHYHKHPPLPKVSSPPYHHHPLPKIFPPFHNKKPYPPPVPTKKPCPPLPKIKIPKKTYPPIPKKTYPPIPKIPNKPCPPLPNLPPPEFFHHPKFGKLPPPSPHHF